MFRPLILIACLIALSACSSNQPWAEAEKVAAATYKHPGAKTVSLVTIVGTSGAKMGHTALLINGSERVLYDPAGTWYSPLAPERADLHYGITDAVLQNYISYHAREGFEVLKATKVVSPAVADRMIANAIAVGGAAGGLCSANAAQIISMTPGFEGFPVSIWPTKTIEAFLAIPGLAVETYAEDDEGKNL